MSIKHVRWADSVRDSRPSRALAQRRTVFMENMSTIVFAPDRFAHAPPQLLRALRRKLIRGRAQCEIVPIYVACDPQTLPVPSDRPYWLSEAPSFLCCLALVEGRAMLGLYECRDLRDGVFVARLADRAALVLLQNINERAPRAPGVRQLRYSPLRSLPGAGDTLPSGVSIAALRFV